METIKVISHLDRVIRGRFDGKDFVFKPEEPVLLSVDAATFIFGLGEEDKTGPLNRLGLLVPGKDTYQEALAKLDQITFMEGKVIFDDEGEPEDSAEGEGEEPARRGRRTGGRRPHVGPSGEAAEPQGSAAVPSAA